MPAPIIELVAYRAARAAQTATPIFATGPANLRLGTDSAVAALAVMAIACRAWVESLQKMRVAALEIAARSAQLQEDARILRAQSHSVSEIANGLSTFAAPSQRAAD